MQINCRAWITKPNSVPFGPNSFHTDGFSDGHLKVMLYPNGLNISNGSFQFKGYKKIEAAPPGYAICFKNSDIEHSGVAGTEVDRLCVELTLQRTLVSTNQINKSLCNGRHLQNPWIIYSMIEENLPSALDTKNSPSFINVGSGKSNWGDKWLCLDEIDAEGVTQFHINQNSIFPAKDNSIKLIYTSHHLEHQDDQTVNQILKESFRCIEPGGHLIIKIPDYDMLLSRFANKNLECIKGKGIESVVWSWKSKNLEPSLLYAFSMMFCGYWNNSYGDHFSGKVNQNRDAYHGPAVCSKKYLIGLLQTNNPHLISKSLCNIALQDPNFKSFNHRNAWSKKQLKNILSKHGFKYIEKSKSEMDAMYSNVIPDWHSNGDWSMYALFAK